MFQVAVPAQDRPFRSEPRQQHPNQQSQNQNQNQRHHHQPPSHGKLPGRGPRSRSSLPPPTVRASDEDPEDSIRKGLYAALAQATHQRDHGAAAAARPLGALPADDEAAELFFSSSGMPPGLTAPATRSATTDGNFRQRPRPSHQKRFSASASFPSAPVENNEALLRPPPRPLRIPSRAPAAPATMSYPAAVQVMPAPQYNPYRPPNDYYPAAGHYTRANDRPVEQSTEDFVVRTERSAARGRAMEHHQRQHQHQHHQEHQEQHQRQHEQQQHHHHHQQQQQQQQRHGHQQYHQRYWEQQEQRNQHYQRPAFQSRPQDEYGQPGYAQQEHSHHEHPQYDYEEYRWFMQQEYQQHQGRQQEYPRQEQRQESYRTQQHEYPPRGHPSNEHHHQPQGPSNEFHEFVEQRRQRQEQGRQPQPQQNFQRQRGPQPMHPHQEHSSLHHPAYQGQHQSQHQQPQPQQQQQQQQQKSPPQSQPQQQRRPPQQEDRYEQQQARQQQPQAPQTQQQQQRQLQQQPTTIATPALETPASEARQIPESLPGGPPRPMVYNTPRRISSASSVSVSSGATTLSRDSFESRMRSPSWSSQTSLESFYSAHSAVQNGGPSWNSAHAWQRPPPLKARRKAKPGELFAALPGEVLEMILDEVKRLHLAPGSMSCATCWMRDACSVALSARKWLKYARTALYEDVLLVGADSAIHKKKYKNLVGTRLVLLRRSLRANPILAAAVRSLKVPATPPNVSAEEYQKIVATVVMACPNLERVVGFYPTYDHSYARFFQALCSRQRLKDMVWLIQPSPFQRQQRMRRPTDEQGTMAQQRALITPGDLQPLQAVNWLENHSNWRSLTSLTVHCNSGATLTPDTLLTDTLARLPALQTLHLSHLPHNAFGDAALLSLPPLKKLSMFHLSGISSAGLSAFATRQASRSLKALTLAHLDIASLPALARALSNLTSLESLSLVQSFAPVLPADEFIWLFPYLASASLKRLHWDMTSAVSQASATDSILAKSIMANGFPALHRLRAPADPEGLFQSLCKPQEKIDLPADRHRHQSQNQRPDHSRADSSASSQPSSDSGSKAGGGLTGTPTSPRFPAGAGSSATGEPPLSSDLHQARLAAQARLEAARLTPKFLVNVVDEDGSLVDRFGLGAFMGDEKSKIAYHLLPDPGALDETGGLVGVTDLIGDGGEDLTAAGGAPSGAVEGRETPMVLSKKEKERLQREKSKAGGETKTREGCQGQWNMVGGAVVDKKDKERWFHTERGRWRGVTLS